MQLHINLIWLLFIYVPKIIIGSTLNVLNHIWCYASWKV
jgi:hypothetical protein